MADISVTAASVIAGSNVVKERGIAGETIIAGQAVLKSAVSGKYLKADADAATPALGIALNGASDGQPLTIALSGDITLNAVLTANTAYFLSSVAGGICILADVGVGEYLCQLGVARSTTVLQLNIQSTGVAN